MRSQSDQRERGPLPVQPDRTIDVRELADAARGRALRDRARAIEMSRRAVAMRDRLAESQVGAHSYEAAQVAFRSLPTPAAMVSAQGAITATNPAWRARFGDTLRLGSDFGYGWRALGGDHAVVGAIDRVVSGAAGTDLEADLAIGPTRRLLVQIAPVPAGGSAVVVIVDITIQHEYETRLLFEASHDPLTGLANRPALLRELAAATVRRARYGDRFGVVYLDLNGFKPINDEHGHAVGDEVLRQVAVRWRAVVRAPEVLARLGGDEFVVLVPHLDSDDQLNTLAGRLSGALETPFAVGRLQIAVSTAFGTVEPPAGAQPDEALSLADHLMYEHKRRLSRGLGAPTVSRKGTD